MKTELNFSTKIENSALTIFLSGELTDETLRPTGYKIMKSASGHSSIIIDVTSVLFISQEGLAFLIKLYNEINSAGSSFHIRGPRGQVEEVLERTGLDKFLPNYESGDFPRGSVQE